MAVHANDFALHIEGRATRIALVDRSVDLDEIVIRAIADVASAGRDDPGRDSSTKAERIPDRKDPVTRSWLAGRELGKRKLRATLDLDQREIGARIGTDDPSGAGLTVVGGDLQPRPHHRQRGCWSRRSHPAR